MKFPTYGKIKKCSKPPTSWWLHRLAPEKRLKIQKRSYRPMTFDDLVGPIFHINWYHTAATNDWSILGHSTHIPRLGKWVSWGYKYSHMVPNPSSIEHGSPKKSMARYHWDPLGIFSGTLGSTKKTCHDPILPSSAGQLSPIEIPPSF